MVKAKTLHMTFRESGQARFVEMLRASSGTAFQEMLGASSGTALLDRLGALRSPREARRSHSAAHSTR